MTNLSHKKTIDPHRTIPCVSKHKCFRCQLCTKTFSHGSGLSRCGQSPPCYPPVIILSMSGLYIRWPLARIILHSDLQSTQVRRKFYRVEVRTKRKKDIKKDRQKERKKENNNLLHLHKSPLFRQMALDNPE